MTQFEQIDIGQAKELMVQGDIMIIDVRDSESYKEAHIEHAVSINDGNIKDFLEETDETKPIICYCYHGHSSQNAATYFLDNGFKNVYSLLGGFEAWRETHPFVSGD